MASDREFLEELDGRLHRTGTGEYGKGGPQVGYHTHTDDRLESGELERLLGLMNKEDFVLLPCNTSMGMSSGFDVLAVTQEGMLYSYELVLRFSSRQLPEGVKWAQVAKHYMGDRNLELARLAGLPRPEPQEHHYDY